jgi:hypothetical protein
MDDDFGLKIFIERCNLLRLKDSAYAAEILLKRFSQKGYLDTDVAKDLIATFNLEYLQRGDREEREFEILERIFRSAVDKREKSGKKIALNFFKDEQRFKELDKSMGIIYDELHSVSITDRNKMLLLCLGHIVRWEVRGQDVKYLLKQIGNISFSQKNLDKLIDKFLMIETLGSDEKSDTFHIRNAVAHGRFRFHDDHIELWDVEQKTKIETFRTKKDIKGVKDFCIAFETKLHSVPLYYSFLIMMGYIAKHNRNVLKTK